MKKNVVRLCVFVIFLFAIVPSCSKKDSGSSAKQCNFATYTVATTSAVEVTYTATNSSGGTISSLIYQGAAGAVTVASPTLPWTLKVTVPKGANVSISAVGSAPSGGSLSVSYSIDYS